MKVTIEFPDAIREYNVGWLDAVRLVATAAGYVDVDVEEFPEKVTIEARGSNGEASASGPSLAAACEKFCRKVSES